MGGPLGRLHEDGFRQVELARDGLHLGVGEAIGIQHDGQRIAGETAIGENVERVELERRH